MTTLLDSVILIDYLNDIEAAREYVGANEKDVGISVVTASEVLVGTSGEGKRATIRFLDAFPLLEIDRETAHATARLRRRHGWKLPDAFQAAIAQRHGLTLATRNTRDFDPDVHAFVDIPYRM